MPRLHRQAKAVARRERTTLRALLEEGLRWALTQRRRRAGFELRDGSVGGEGVHPGVDEGNWGTIRDDIYAGRGS